ncbi:MAG: hypothetical protein V4480_02590 [Patescibacteria group bacterium]
MDKEDLKDQYDRFLEQVRTEAKDLYWLFNFFFVIESALLIAAFTDKLSLGYMHLAEVTGFLLSLYWFLIVRKQRLWRNHWVERIQTVEEELGISSTFQMWPARSRTTMKDFVAGRRGVWRLLFVLPVGFAVLWAVLFVGG